MIYVDYEYYASVYGGTLSEGNFEILALKASRIIDNNINTVLNEYKISKLNDEEQDKLKYTTCSLIDLLERKEQSENNRLNSLSIDGVSKSYKVMDSDEYNKNLNDIIKCLPNCLTYYK